MTLATKVVANASALVAGRFLIIASGILTVGISARYLGADSYGALVVAMAFVSIVGTVTDLGLTTVGAREIAKRPDEARRIIGSVLAVSLAMAVVAGLIGLVLMSVIYAGPDNSLTRQGIAILLVTLLANPAISAAGAWFVSEQQAWITMIASVVGTASALGLLILATALDLGFQAIVFAYAAGLLINSLAAAALLLRRITPARVLDVALVKQLLKWSLPIAGLALLNGFYARIDLLLVSFLQSDADAGMYGLAYKVVDALVLLPPYIMVTLLPAVARLEPHSERLAELTQKAFAGLEVAAVAMLVLIAGFAEEIIKIVGGSSFERAVPVLQILMVGVAIGFINGVFGNSLIALNQQARMLKLAPFVLAINVALNLVLIPRWGIEGAALALTLTEVAGLGMVVYLYQAVGSLPSIHRGPQVILAASAMAVVVLAKTLPFASGMNPVLVIVLFGNLSVVVYVACLYRLRAMPAEVHTGILQPAWNRLRP